ncbi:MAG: alpha/beta fold hydrolase [Actinobacteria bacterium]|nr:alpha/beta fold hydrolase [Actinomycetota bacterium]MBI3686886.1 alpha/beta fold hydrolase [Actinomycetota bacterium]
MHFTSEATSDGVLERLFTVDDIPGVLWSPAGAIGARPLLLVGHGGGRHKTAPGMALRAHRYVTALGFAVAAIDAPGHGDRPKTEQDDQRVAGIRERVAAGEPLGPHIAHYNAELSVRAVPEWRIVLDALQELDCVGPDGPIGYVGVSMGGGIGVRFVAAEPRITAAVLGLVGLAGPTDLAEVAARITVPVEFLMQWDDEMVPRDSSLGLFDAFGSTEKTLHANPGGHGEMPVFERDSSERFFTRHLLGGAAPATADDPAVAGG